MQDNPIGRFAQGVFRKIEDTSITLPGWIMGFLAILFVRFFLESFVDNRSVGFFSYDLSTLVHYTLFFLAAALCLMLLWGSLTRDYGSAAKYALYFFIVIWTVPILDFIFSGGHGFSLSYFPYVGKDIFRNFLFPFIRISGITPGLQVEGLIILIGGLLVGFLKTKKLWKGIVFGAVLYCLVTLLGSIPGIIASLGNVFTSSSQSIASFFHSTGLSSLLPSLIFDPRTIVDAERARQLLFNTQLSEIFYILSTILLLVFAVKAWPHETRAVLKNSRLVRAGHYIFFVLLGIWTTTMFWVGPFHSWSGWDYAGLAVLLLSFYFNWMAAVAANDIEDVDIDKMTNPNRPLFQGVPAAHLKSYGFFFAMWSLLGAALLGGYMLYFAIVFLFVAHAYSAMPLRLRTLALVPSVLMAIATTAAFISGFYFSNPDKSVDAVPVRAVVAIIISCALFFNFKDIKDIESDKAHGVLTLPVLFRNHAWIASAITASSFLVATFILGGGMLLVPGMLASLALFFVLQKKPFKEWPVFMIYLLFFFALFLYCFANGFVAP